MNPDLASALEEFNAATPDPPMDVPPRVIDELARINTELDYLRGENQVLRESLVRLAGVRAGQS